MNCILNIKTILDIIFSISKKNANILANTYLLKDVSIVSKWKNSKAIPKNDDILRVIDFVINESTLSQQKIIRDSLEELVKMHLLIPILKKSYWTRPILKSFCLKQ